MNDHQEEMLNKIDNVEIKNVVDVLTWVSEEQRNLNTFLSAILQKLDEIKKIVSEEK